MNRVLRLLGIALATLAVIGLVAFLAFSIRSSRELEQAQSDYAMLFGEPDLFALAPAEPEADDNAATWLVAGANAVVRVPKSRWLARLSRTPASKWSEEDRRAADEMIATNQPAFELLERATGCSSSSFGIKYEDGALARLPDFFALLKAHRLVSIRARTRFAVGETAAFRADLRLMSLFANAISQESLMISSLIVLTLDLDYLDVLQEALVGGVGDPDWLDEVRSALARMARRELVWRALRAEGAIAASLSTTTVQDSMMEQRAKFGPDLPGLLGWPATRRLQASFLRASTEAASRIDRPYGEWINGGPKTAASSLHWPGSGRINGPPLMNAIGRLQAGETARLLALEAVRLSRTRAVGGSYSAYSLLPKADPFAGSACRRSTGDDGGPVLECPAAFELFESSVGQRRSESANLFRWRLPA